MESLNVSHLAAFLAMPSVQALGLGVAIALFVWRWVPTTKADDIPLRGHWQRDDIREVIQSEYLNASLFPSSQA